MSSPIENEPGVLFMLISQALNDLGDSSPVPDARIAPAVELLSKINAEYVSDPTQAKIDANSLAVQVNALMRSHPDAARLADAVDAAEQLAGTWSGSDYV